MELSYWERQSFFNNAGVVIIGSGIVGLQAAIHLKEKSPGLKVMIIERGFLPYGASTRNAGFACFGSAGELLDDLTHMSEDEVCGLVEKRFLGLQKLRRELGDHHIGYEAYGGYEVFMKQDASEYEKCMENLSRLNTRLNKITGRSDTYITDPDALITSGLSGFYACIRNTCEGQIDTGMMMESLLKKAAGSGVMFLNGIGVKSIAEDGDMVNVITDHDFDFRAKHVLVTTNGFAQQLLPGIDVIPARAQVLITQPVNNLKLKGAFHYDKGFYYFRNVNDRVLLGGGRNLDFNSEQTHSFGLTKLIQERLDQVLREHILPGYDVKAEMRWSGIMGLGKTKSAIIKKLSPHITCAVRMGGMGIAIGSLVGEEGAKLVLEE